MEKKIKFNLVVGFIYEAIRREYYIRINEGCIIIERGKEYLTTKECEYAPFSFRWYEEENTLLISVDTNTSFYYQLKIENPKDIAKWNILIEDVKEYVFSKIEYKFNNYMLEDGWHREYKRPKDIDDLNDEE